MICASTISKGCSTPSAISKRCVSRRRSSNICWWKKILAPDEPLPTEFSLVYYSLNLI